MDKTTQSASETTDSLEELFSEQPENESEKADENVLLRLYQMDGFHIATGHGVDIYAALEEAVKSLKDKTADMHTKWAELYQDCIRQLDVKLTVFEEKLLTLKDKEAELETEIQTLKTKRESLQKELDEFKKELIGIRGILTDAKKGLGERFITDVQHEMLRVLELHKILYEKVKALNEDRYENTKDALTQISDKLKALRVFYVDRYDVLSARIRALHASGVNQRVAYTIIGLASATAGVAGYFFAIFSSASNYSSQDAFYYLLKNMINATSRSAYPFLLQFAYFFGALAVITGFSFLMDYLIKVATNFNSKASGDQYLDFGTQFKVEGIDYSYNAQSRTWLILWLRIAPFLLLTGTLLLLLSHGTDIHKSTDQLSASTEGLLIGTALAMGLAAVVYIYLIKIVEKRAEEAVPDGKLRHNWELISAIVVFLAIIIVFIFYRGEAKDGDFENAFSIAGFLGACLLTAFGFGYGIRFLGLLESLNIVENKIALIDRNIALNSIPEQQYLDVNYKTGMTELMNGLAANIRRKNHLLENMRSDKAVSLIEEQRGKQHSIRRLNIFKPGSAKNDFEDSGLFEILEWEVEYFPEYAEKLKIYGSIYRDRKRQLEELERNIHEEVEKKNKILKEHHNTMQKIEEEKDRIRQQQAKANKMRLQREETNDKVLHIKLTSLKDGFDLGLWYRSYGIGHQHHHS